MRIQENATNVVSGILKLRTAVVRVWDCTIQGEKEWEIDTVSNFYMLVCVWERERERLEKDILTHYSKEVLK